MKWMMPADSWEPGAPVRVLLVEHDDRLARQLARYLEGRGMQLSFSTDGERGLIEASTQAYDVVLLAAVLPILDGLAVCRELRARKDVPIILLTAQADETELCRALECGADDCVAKPFSARELDARIRAHVRRHRGFAGPSGGPRRVGRLTIDSRARHATLDDRVLPLTGYEFSLLLALADRPGKILSREQLLELVKGNSEEAFDRSIDGHISRLRQKLGDDPRRPALLKTIRGAGYVLTVSE